MYLKQILMNTITMISYMIYFLKTEHIFYVNIINI